MIDEVYNPVVAYRNKFRNRFKEVANETFDELLKLSKIDVQKNRIIVEKIENSEQIIKKIENHLFWLNFWKWSLWILIFCCIAGIAFHSKNVNVLVVCVAILILSLTLIFVLISPKINESKQELESEEETVKKNKEMAWNQMAPLNRLFDWDITVRMISKTIPKIQFDPFFTEGRLQELCNNFGFDISYNSDKSVLFAHSGEINGNPFVLGRVLYMKWGTKVYEGFKKISYRVSTGKNSYIRTQTLRATVEKPYPEYYTETFLLYGCDAAPHLIFFRNCSGLANDDSFWGRRNFQKEQKKLEKFSRKLDDASQYTMMSNREFETLFNTSDRNNEVEFRLLFTPMAQKQMVDILRDKTEGYGDDFSFKKQKKINVITAKHLADLDIDNNPNRYKSYSVSQSKLEFISYNQNYFKSLYFAFAPLLAIPIYQQIRSHENIYDLKNKRKSCFWEHEALANFYGDEKFKHPKCVTRSILKTKKVLEENGIKLSVTASGYKTKNRIDIVRVVGGDRRYHNVSVPWNEYLEVSNSHFINLEEDDQAFFNKEMNAQERYNYIQSKKSSVQNSIYRRSILSFWDKYV